MNPRRVLLELFDHALREVDGAKATQQVLDALGPGPVALFAIGKAACSMTRGAYAACGAGIRQALLVTKDGHVDPEVARLPNLRSIESAHPVPDARSLEAGAELARRVAALDADEYPVFLVSGGSSSLVELLQPGVTLDDLRALNERGLAAGWDIATLNAERARLSRLKQGGVARLLGGRPAHALFISDVPDDDPGVIGSGLLGASAGMSDRILRIVTTNIDIATWGVAGAGAARGLNIERRAQRFSGDAAEVARGFVEALRNTAADGLVWGGESTVVLPASPGRGGRNQHLALTAARLLKRGEPLTMPVHWWMRSPSSARNSRASTWTGRCVTSTPASRSKPRKISCTPVPRAPTSGICSSASNRMPGAFVTPRRHACSNPVCVCCSSTTTRATALCCDTTYRARGPTSIS